MQNEQYWEPLDMGDEGVSDTGSRVCMAEALRAAAGGVAGKGWPWETARWPEQHWGLPASDTDVIFSRAPLRSALPWVRQKNALAPFPGDGTSHQASPSSRLAAS